MDKYFEKINQINHIEILAKQIVEGFLIGLHKSPFHGFSVEFSEHRLYNEGESVKNVDWKVFARTDKMYVKKYEEETNLRCQILLDISSSMYFPENSENKLNFSALCAASLIYLLKSQRDAFGLTTFSDKIYFHADAKLNENNRNNIYAQLEHLLNQKPKSQITNAKESIHAFAEMIHRRSLVVIFSDMFDNIGDANSMQDLIDALQHLKYNKHEVVLFHVIDKRHEIDFEYENRPYEFIDIETNQSIKLHTNMVKEKYKALSEEFVQDLKIACLQNKIDFVEVDINEGFQTVLQTYLLKRSKMVK